MTPHDWMFRFGFPGFAEVEWVLPAGVDHPEPWYEPLPGNMAVLDLEGWSLRPTLQEKLRELHEATVGAPLVEPHGAPFHALMDPLRDAFARGVLVAWVLRTNAVERPAQLPVAKPGKGTELASRVVFEVAVIDEIGAPVPSVEIDLQLSTGRATVVTDGAGKGRVDGTREPSATARIANEDDVRSALHERWKTVRGRPWISPDDFAPERTIEVCRAETFASARVHSYPAGTTPERHTFILQPRVAHASLHGKWFDRRKAFVLPTALDGVRFIVERSRENPDAELLVVGHCDPTDEPGAGQLSLDRARALVAFLCEDAAAWLPFYDDARPARARWGRREDELMIEAAALERGEVIPFGVSVVRWYAAARGAPGATIEALRPMLIAEYMRAHGTTLAKRSAVAHGCGSAFPLDPADAVGGRQSRRMEIFLFENPLRSPATESAILPPPPGEIAQQGSPVRAEWLLRSRRRWEHFVGPPSPPRCHVSILARSNSGRVFLARRSFTLHSGDGRKLEGTTDDDGLVTAECVAPQDYLLEIDGVEVWVPAMPLDLERRVTRVPSYFVYKDRA